MSRTSASVLGHSSEVAYAESDGAHLAYRVISGNREQGLDVVLLTAGTASMDALFDDPVGQRILTGLAVLGRLVVFDRSGIGLSDPPTDWSESPLSRWCDDLAAVIETAHVHRPVLVSTTLSASVALLYCDRHPDAAVTSMVMIEPYPPGGPDPDLLSAQLRGDVDSVALFFPSRADEPGFREWFNQAGRVGASPRLAARAHPVPSPEEVHDIEQAAARTSVPTLVLRRPAHPLSPEPANDEVLSLIPGARRVDLPGEDLFIFGGEVDILLAEVHGFVTGERRPPAAERSLAAIVFSDLVASTERAVALGDARWKRLIERHDDCVRFCTERRGGTVVKTTGDGALAVFASATDAVRAASELRAALLRDELRVRIGIHVGDIDHRDGDVSGIAVTVAARVMAQAGAGDVLVSDAVPLVVTGSRMRFEDRGRHELKGVGGTWHLSALADESFQ